MPINITMPALSPTMEEGNLAKWLVKEGDKVGPGDVIAEIETDKATMELVARGDGVLRKIFLGEGGTAEVGAVIGVIAGADEDISGVEGASGGGGAAAASDEGRGGDEEGGDEANASDGGADAPDQPPAAEAPADKPAAASGTSDQAATAGGSSDGRVKASPLARRLAEEAGLDLSRISGSGPGGRVVKRDVEKAKEEGVSAPTRTTQAWSPDESEYEDVPVSQMRKAIAKRLVQSIGPVPTFYLTIDVDMGRAMEARASMNASLKDAGVKISFNDIVLKATAAALRQHPNCNAQWQDDHIRRYNAVHLGVAVAIEDGLITPIIRNAHRKGLVQIGEEVKEMAGRAREKKLKPEEYTGATFSVSNLGMFGIHEFTAIINPPEAGILAVGGIEETPVVVDGEVVVRPRMRITMSCDHRVIDGAQGSRFLQTLKTMLEEPAAILL